MELLLKGRVDHHRAQHVDFFKAGVVQRLGFLGEHQFLVQLLAGAQAAEADLDVLVRPQAAEADEVFREVRDLHRRPHVEYEDVAAFADGGRLQYQLRSFRDGHEVAGDLRVGHGHRAAPRDLLHEERDDAAV